MTLSREQLRMRRERARTRRRRRTATVAAVVGAVGVALAARLVPSGAPVATAGVSTAAGMSSNGTPVAAAGVGTGTTAPHVPADRPPHTRAPAKSARVRMAFTGDTMMGTGEYGLPPDDGRTVLEGVKHLLTGDLVVGNLEGTLTNRGTSKCGDTASDTCYAFRSPPAYATQLRRGGFTMMTLANNHANDYGAVGRLDTDAALQHAGLLHTGSPGSIAVTRVRGVRVAVIAFAPYSWANRLDDVAAAQRMVRKASTLADVVVVTMHAGAEGPDHQHVRPGTEHYLGEARGDAIAFARAAVDVGADLVVGHGPHVLRGMEFYRGRLIAYSLGNFVGYKAFDLAGPTSTSGVLQVTLGADGAFVTGRLRAVHLVGAGVPTPGGDAVAVVRRLSRADLPRSAARLTSDGTILPPAGLNGR